MLAGLVLVLGAAAQDVVVLSPDLRVWPLQEDLWIHETTAEFGGQPVTSNGLVVVDGDEVVVVDTAWGEAPTERLLRWIIEVRGWRVRALVATHFHADRLGGVAPVHARGIETYGLHETAARAPGAGLPPPGVRFERLLTLTVGQRLVECRFPGAGHSADNLVVWIPDARVLYGGCLIKSTAARDMGYVGDADLAAWPATLRAVKGHYPKPRWVVPGHGAPGGLDLIDHTLTLLARAQSN